MGSCRTKFIASDKKMHEENDRSSCYFVYFVDRFSPIAEAIHELHEKHELRSTRCYFVNAAVQYNYYLLAE